MKLDLIFFFKFFAIIFMVLALCFIIMDLGPYTNLAWISALMLLWISLHLSCIQCAFCQKKISQANIVLSSNTKRALICDECIEKYHDKLKKELTKAIEKKSQEQKTASFQTSKEIHALENRLIALNTTQNTEGDNDE